MVKELLQVLFCDAESFEKPDKHCAKVTIHFPPKGKKEARYRAIPDTGLLNIFSLSRIILIPRP